MEATAELRTAIDQMSDHIAEETPAVGIGLTSGSSGEDAAVTIDGFTARFAIERV